MKIHTEGCLDIFAEQIGGNIGGVGGVGIGIGLVQVNHAVVDDGDGDGDNYDEKDNSDSIWIFSAYWDDLRNLPGDHHKEAI